MAVEEVGINIKIDTTMKRIVKFRGKSKYKIIRFILLAIAYVSCVTHGFMVSCKNGLMAMAMCSIICYFLIAILYYEDND